MSVSAEEIEAIRGAAVAQLQALLALAGPTVTVGEAEIAWTPWLAHLRACIDWCDGKLVEGAPYEVRSRG